MLVLDGNNPRFPWEPSTTMLNYRLTGTTEASASNRGGRDHCGGSRRLALAAEAAERVAKSSPTLASTEGALRC
jgi:hypothetical protein